MLAEMQMDVQSIIRLAVEKRLPDRVYYRDRIAQELACSWAKAHPDMEDWLSLKFGARDEDVAKLYDLDPLWADVDEIISELEFAMPARTGKETADQIWRHQPTSRLQESKEKDDSLSLEALARCASAYLRAKWAASPTLECWLTRQMIYAETFAFSREVGMPVQIKSARFWWDLAKLSLKWLIGVLVAISVGEGYGAALGVLTYLAWVSMIHFLARDTAKARFQLAKLFLAMQTAYRVALRSGAYPLEMERHLTLAEQEGAVWPEGLRPILQKAISRGVTTWAQATGY